jgi:hypothetical protein
MTVTASSGGAMGTVGLHGTYAAVLVVFAVAIFSLLVSGAAYIVFMSLISGYGARDSSFGPMDAAGTQLEWTDEERRRFRQRRRLALVVMAVVGVTVFGIGLWLVYRAIL